MFQGMVVCVSMMVIGLISVGADGPDKLGGLGPWLGALGILGSMICGARIKSVQRK